MSVTLPSRRWPLFLSIPIFGLVSFIVVFFFSIAYLTIVFPDTGNNLPMETGELSGWQVSLFLSLSASLSATLVGMLSWGLLIVRPWRWLQTQHWRMTALFGGLIGLIEIIVTSCLMWVVYVSFLFFLTQHSGESVNVIILLVPGSIGLGIITLAILASTSKGLVFLGGAAAGIGCALLARRIFSERSSTSR